jgi:hypothetical protein
MVSLCPRTSTAYRFRMRTMPPASAASGATATGDKTLAGFPSKEIPMKTDGLPRQAPDKRKENSTNRCHSYNIDVTGRHGFAIQQLAIETVGPQQSSAKTHLLTTLCLRCHVVMETDHLRRQARDNQKTIKRSSLKTTCAFVVLQRRPTPGRRPSRTSRTPRMRVLLIFATG